MSKKRKKKMNIQSDSATSSPSSEKKEQEKKFPQKTYKRFTYAFPVIFFVASIVSVFICFPSFWKCNNKYENKYANQSLIIIDTLGQKFFVGESNPILMSEKSSIILNEDSVEIGDSILSLLNDYYLTPDSIENCYVSYQIDAVKGKDSISIATVKKDLILCSNNNTHVLYAREGERFLMREKIEKKDSVCILFNNEEYWTKTTNETTRKRSTVKTEVLAISNVSFQEYERIPFKVKYCILDSAEKKVALKFDFGGENDAEDDSLNNTSIRIYHIYGDMSL